jgi:ubiquinone/menaquinone biosynthesis C-methylase UbiE
MTDERWPTVPPAQYDAFAEDFAAHAESSAYNALYDRPAMLALAGDVAGLRVLDAGCGPGLYAEELLARGALVTGFDESTEMVRLARQRLGDQADVRVATLSKPLDWLADASHDLVVLALVLHHLDDRVTALRELRRVLAPGGRLLVSTTHPTSDWLIAGGSYFSVELLEDTWQRGWQVRWWRQPLERWCAEFADAGFVIERLVEPQPAEEMVESFPDVHAKLVREPGFILFQLGPR